MKVLTEMYVKLTLSQEDLLSIKREIEMLRNHEEYSLAEEDIPVLSLFCKQIPSSKELK